MSNLRLISSRVIDKVTDGRSLSDALDEALPSIRDARDKAFVQAVCYGVCRMYTRLDVILSHLLKSPMKAKDSDVHALLLVGLYQLIAMRTPDYAAVTETVNATLQLNKPWAKGLVNAVLREYLRHRDQLETEIEVDSEAHYAHPKWWITKIKKDWPNESDAILNANNQHPPFAIRVNQQYQTREEYLEILGENNLSAQTIHATKSGLIIESPLSVDELPGFSAGNVSVQDGAAQLAAELLDLQANLRVLDACAAPGGKLTHMLEIETQLADVVAVEKDKSRMASIKENLVRLKQQANCVCHDVSDISSWWDEKPFDRILLDAPCSASGVVRRHPDIKLLRQPADISHFAKTQLHLLNSLWPLLAEGGIILYVTCSIFREENVEVVKQFLAAHMDASEVVIEADWGIPCEVGRQILPGMHEMDGFYYAKIRRVD